MNGGWMRRQSRAAKKSIRPGRKRFNSKEVTILEAIEAAKNKDGHRPRLGEIAAQARIGEDAAAEVLTDLEQAGRVARGIYDARSYRDLEETTPRRRV